MAVKINVGDCYDEYGGLKCVMWVVLSNAWLQQNLNGFDN